MVLNIRMLMDIMRLEIDRMSIGVEFIVRWRKNMNI